MLQIIRLKPNPAGKDSRQGTPLTVGQLAAEWVDVENPDSQAVNLDGVTLHHLAYPASGGKPEWQQVTSLTGSLPAGAILRIHSGERRDLSVIRPVDLAGASHHVFTGSDRYIWNNKEQDCAWIGWVANQRGDKACYDANPPEGVILYRNGEKLVPAGAPVG